MSALLRGAVLALVGVALTAGPAGAKPAATGTVYGGYSAQGSPVVVTLNAGHTAIKTVGIYVDNTDGYTYGGTANAVKTIPAGPEAGVKELTDTRISGDGTIRTTGREVGYYGDDLGAITYKLNGKVKGQGMSGTMAVKLVLLDPSDQQVVKAVTFPKLSWKASSAPGRVYAGRSTDDEPVVIELNKRHTAANTIRIPWYAESDSTSWWSSETLRNLPLTAGALSRTWSEPYTRDDGGKNTFDYALTLRAAARTAQGSIQVRVTETDASGNVTATCDSGEISFTTRSS